MHIMISKYYFVIIIFLFISTQFSPLTAEAQGDIAYEQFYFPYIERFVEFNETNSLVAFQSTDNKYHNVMLRVNISKGGISIITEVENCQDYDEAIIVTELNESSLYNFIVFKIEFFPEVGVNRSDPNNYLPFTIEVNGSYFVEDLGPARNNLGELERRPCWGVDGFEYFSVLINISFVTTIVLVVRKFNNK